MDKMEKIVISPLSQPVSRICLGTWAIGGWMWGGSDEQESIKTIHKAFELGINMVDTAPIYGFGESEEIVGKAIAQYGHREKLILATKVGLDWSGEKIVRNSSPSQIMKEIDDSLRRLQTDYIDIYQIHWPDTSFSFEKTAQTLVSLLEAGKIRAIGVSNFSTNQMQEFLKFSPIHTSQPPYNLFERGIENEILPFTEDKAITTLAYGALCRGLLSGKINANTQFKGDDLRKIDPKFHPPLFEQYLAAVSALNEFAQKKYNKNVLRWILDRGHTIALWGARHPSQLENVKDVMGWKLEAEDMQQIDRIINQHIKVQVGPEFMAPPL